GAHCRALLPRLGVFLLWYRLDQNLSLDPDQFTLSDFKLAGKETIGARTTQVIQYTAREKGNTPRLAMKLWLDDKTHLPVKLAMTTSDADITATTDTYSEFTVDGKAEAKLFEVPK